MNASVQPQFKPSDTVSYTSIQGITRTGTVVSVFYDYDFPAMTRYKYEVRMDGNRHTAIYYSRELKAVVSAPAAPVPCDAPVADQLTRLRRIEDAFQAWETAYFAGRYEEAGRLSAIHDRLLDEHMAMLFGKGAHCPKNAPQTPHKPIPAAVEEVQAFSGALDQKSPEIASEPFAPLNGKNDHPLALIEPGSVAAKTDWDALKVKRDSQFAEAYLRIYGIPFERKQAAGGAK